MTFEVPSKYLSAFIKMADASRHIAKAKRQAIVEEWHREQVRKAVPPLLEKWQRLMGIRVTRFFVQRMKTKWGSCNDRAPRFG